MRRPRVWVLVADSGAARVYRSTGQFEMHQALLELVPDGVFRRDPSRPHHPGPLPGKSFASALGTVRHTVTTHDRQRRLIEEAFLRRVAVWLSDRRQDTRYDHLVVIAPPRVLGSIRKALPKAQAAKVIREIRADLIKSPIKEIESHVANDLNPTHAVA